MKRLLLIAALVIGIAALVWFIAALPREPIYQGKPLSYWLDQFRTVNGDVPGAQNAVRTIGTNAIPALLDDLRARDSRLKSRLMQFAQKHRWFKVGLAPATFRQARALRALPALGPQIAGAIPALEGLLNGPFGPSICHVLRDSGTVGILPLTRAMSNPTNRVVASVAEICLSQTIIFGKAPRAEVVSLLASNLNDASVETRRQTALAATIIISLPREVVSALEPHVNDPDATVRHLILAALMRNGDRAEVVPILIRTLSHPDPVTRRSATNLLDQIHKRGPIRRD